MSAINQYRGSFRFIKLNDLRGWKYPTRGATNMIKEAEHTEESMLLSPLLQSLENQINLG